MGLLGDVMGGVGGILGMFGNDMPTYKAQSLAKGAGQAMDFNLGNLPKATELGKGVTAYTTAETEKTLAKLMPWASGLAAKQAGLAEKWMGGELSNQEIGNIQRFATGRGLGAGTGAFGTSELTGNTGLLKFMDTTFGREQAGMGAASSLSSWMGNALQMARGGVYDISSMQINPLQGAQFSADQAYKEYQSQVLAAGGPSSLQQIGGVLQQGGALFGDQMQGGFEKLWGAIKPSGGGGGTNYGPTAGNDFGKPYAVGGTNGPLEMGMWDMSY